ncbi:FAD-binding oxidoreductase [Cupriavidus sp. WGtm5]|uniref:NAD(P)/FAD-dependent oxidoreductase n=1 Tax=Cupriavidus sp. WGtm5 TaxID=2919926 RepID=UPI002091D825|nr:FAD-binding oxidoreductase [Cupriavidus sp. WGtm5]MCO4887745.1 FAD-binding oxidoreductase [Cupriavidus sp. WGtm5]
MAHQTKESGNVTEDFKTYRTLGGWIERPADLQPSLEGHTNADVVIVGAGFAGLCAALELARQRVKVVVLEREFCGYGASSRNAGYLAGGQGLKYDRFLKRAGHDKARQIVRFYEDGVSFAEGKFAEHEIDCDYNQSGLIRAGIDPSQDARLRDDMRISAELGCPSEYLDQAEMRARGIPPAFLFGSYVPNGGTLDPGKYVLGLRRAALRAGVTIYENTPLLSFTEGSTVKVQTPRGSVSAPVMILATNAYTPRLGPLADKVVPLRLSAMETEPLSPVQLAALGWYRREGITTMHWVMESHRLTARNTLVLTTKRLRYPFGSRTPEVPEHDQYRALRMALHDRFPPLRSIAIRRCWSGYISYADDGLPVIGRTGADRNIYYAAGCSGHGVGTQGMVGHMLAQDIQGIGNPLLAMLMQHAPPATLPEPLRWLALNGALKVASGLDERSNRKARRA